MTDEEKLDALLAHCPEPECGVCASIICPHGSTWHFHHDGCPACAELGHEHPVSLSCARGSERAEKAERQRDNLLARIFRDGGHKQDSFASRDEACEAADLLVAEAYGELEELRLKSGQDVMKTSKPNKQSAGHALKKTQEPNS